METLTFFICILPRSLLILLKLAILVLRIAEIAVTMIMTTALLCFKGFFRGLAAIFSAA